MKLYIVYGSESLLLEKFYKEKSNCYFIRIYNNKIPEKRKNFFDIQISNFEKNFQDLYSKLKKKITKVVFLGVGFVADSNIFFSIKEKEISTLIDANIKNYLLITKIILPIMIRINAGKFIYLSSFRSKIPTRGTAIYSACKAFGEIFFKTIGQEYGRLGITSHIIRMGYFEGRLLDNLTNEKKLKILKRISTGRLGNAKDLAGTIKTVENLNYNNSGIIEINGGLDFE